MGSNLHLVDDQGRPLPKHIVDAVERVEPMIMHQFSRSCDPADLSDSMEHGARKIARRETRKGALPDADSLGGLTWRSLLNSAISGARMRRSEQTLSEGALRNLTDVTGEDNPETRLTRIQEKEALFSELSSREQKYWALREQGFEDNEIAAYLQLSKNALAQLKHRLKTKLIAKGLLKK